MAGLLLAGADAARALPRYAARYGQKCLLCHADPGGGGMRSAYASQFIVPEELAMLRRAEDAPAIDPQLGDRVSVGLDLRTLARYSAEDSRRDENNFFQMQGDLTLRVELDERLSATFKRGLSGGEQVYATAFVLPARGYATLGRFGPSYGWRFADHTAFVRRELGFSPPGDSDVGAELGLFPGNASLSLGLFNGAAPGQLRDGDDRFILIGRAEWRERLGAMKLGLGASWRRSDENPLAAQQAYGPFAYWSWGPATWVGEWDLFDRPAAGGFTDALATSHELSVELIRGLALRATFDFLDPDLDRRSGSRARIGLGGEALVTPFTGIQVMVNVEQFDEGEAVSGEDYVQGVMVLHVLY